MSDRILVTGGAGFVGSHLTRKLLDRGHHVRVLDAFLYGDDSLKDLRSHPNLEVVRGDICDPVVVEQCVRGVKGVAALAAIVGDAACELSPQRTHAVNYESTKILLEACRRAGVQRIVFSSSCSVYGANGTAPVSETSPLHPVSLYAETRIASENLLLEQCGPVEVVILRLATVCGVSPRMRFDLMVNTMTAAAVTRGEIHVFGPQQWRPHLHVQDAAEAFVLGLESPAAAGGIFNVGSGDQNFTIAEVAQRVSRGVGGVPIHVHEADGDRRSYRVSFDRIRDVLGFRARYTVDDAVAEVRDLLARHPGLDVSAPHFYNVRWLQRAEGCRGAA